MAIPRFYTPNTIFTVGKQAFLTDDARHHAGRVLRLLAGDEVCLFDGLGNVAFGPIAFEGEKAFVSIQNIEKSKTESTLEITLIQSLISLEKLDWVLEKSVEVGVRHVIVIPAKHSIVRLDEKRLQKRLVHWKDILVSACEQSGRDFVPTIEFMPLETALTHVNANQRYMLALSSSIAPKLTNLQSVAFAVGPEGGFSPEEVALAGNLGWTSVLIGPRVLRTETAGLVAATIANAASGDLKFL